MKDIDEIIEEISSISNVEQIVLTDESGSPFELEGLVEDEEKAAIAAFIGGGINSMSNTLDLDDFQSMNMQHENGTFMLYPVGSLFLGLHLKDPKILSKTKAKIDTILIEN